jgi:protein gp37
VDPKWRADLFALIAQTPELDWLLLTKRIGNVRSMLPADWGDGWPHVWIGATVVNQIEAERDIPKFVVCPRGAAVPID